MLKDEKYMHLSLLTAVLFTPGVAFAPSRQRGQVGASRLLYYACHVMCVSCYS